MIIPPAEYSWTGVKLSTTGGHLVAATRLVVRGKGGHDNRINLYTWALPRERYRKTPSIYTNPSKDASPRDANGGEHFQLDQPALSERPKKPEVLAPAGNWSAAHAAVENGADAIYFGLEDFNARARAENFTEEDLPSLMRYLHERGVKGYLVLNVLIFNEELECIAARAQIAKAAKVDAVIVQDIGAVEIIKAAAPGLAIHGSTQMTVTSVHGMAFAHQLGIERVVVGRELSISDIGDIRKNLGETDVEIEAFVHGALCVSYSGQCFSSEAWGGRSANRGQCAQACRLQYGMVVDGELTDLNGQDYVLSPQDLAAFDLVPELIQAGVVSLKIEGRLKSPEYVAMTVQTYRNAVDQAWNKLCNPVSNFIGDTTVGNDEQTWRDLRQIFSRGQSSTHAGLTHGFLAGPKHQELVIGRAPRHRGLFIGEVLSVNKHTKTLKFELKEGLKQGDGLVIDSGSPEQEEQGGDVFSIVEVQEHSRKRVDQSSGGRIVEILLGPEPINPNRVRPGDFIWKNKDPALLKRLRMSYESISSSQRRRIPVDVQLQVNLGEKVVFCVQDDDGNEAVVTTDAKTEKAKQQVDCTKELKQAVGKHLGDTGSFVLRKFDVRYSQETDQCFIPKKDIKEARRKAIELLLSQREKKGLNTDSFLPPSSVIESLMEAIKHRGEERRAPQAQPRLRVLCRTKEQVSSAVSVSWLEEIILDFLEVKGLKECCDLVRSQGKRVIVATPRILKPDEKWLWLFYLKLQPDALLVRGAGLLHQLVSLGGPGTIIEEADNSPIPILEGDFSLNASNSVTASILLDSGLSLLAPTHDCNATQIIDLINGLGGRRNQIEIIMHTNLPIFHTEHCVYARFLSNGNSYVDCGKPCERHTIHIQDSTGKDHLVEADMGCRNTVFDGASQTGLSYLKYFQDANPAAYRIELVDQPASIVVDLLEGYREAILGDASKTEDTQAFWKWLQNIPDANGKIHGSTSGSFVVRKERQKSEMKPTAASLREGF